MCFTKYPYQCSGFVPPEYIKDGFISKKFDVFSLGVIIIKILAGEKNYIRCSEMPPEQFIQLVREILSPGPVKLKLICLFVPIKHILLFHIFALQAI